MQNISNIEKRLKNKVLMQQEIISFNQDEINDWCAVLQCGHRQHMRHNPPWQNRAWVLDDEQRKSKIGTTLNCVLCDKESL